ncbi:hypothetical protein O6H91_Y067300 [Diphasiastrum complanatum]|nr:hypothetical protein O6H91_Y067300 [Diphasiastrum complanatum]
MCSMMLESCTIIQEWCMLASIYKPFKTYLWMMTSLDNQDIHISLSLSLSLSPYCGACLSRIQMDEVNAWMMVALLNLSTLGTPCTTRAIITIIFSWFSFLVMVQGT